MTERSEQNDACVAATFAATASRALHPVIEIVGERRRAYDDAFRRRVVLASYETHEGEAVVDQIFRPLIRQIVQCLDHQDLEH